MSDIVDKAKHAAQDVAAAANKAAHQVADKANDLAHKATDAAKDAGHVIADKAGQAVDYAKQQAGAATASVTGIKEHMDVVCSAGTKVGVVDKVEAGTVKLTRKDSADGLHHTFPVTWVKSVDSVVHLNKTGAEIHAQWGTA